MLEYNAYIVYYVSAENTYLLIMKICKTRKLNCNDKMKMVYSYYPELIFLEL